MLPIGTRIRFLKTIEEEANDEHPGILFAVKGDFGSVHSHGCREGHWVLWDGWLTAPFGATLDVDFQPV